MLEVTVEYQLSCPHLIRLTGIKLVTCWLSWLLEARQLIFMIHFHCPPCQVNIPMSKSYNYNLYHIL